MARQPLTITTFQYPDGTVVSNGTIQIRLNTNGSVSNTQIQNEFTTISLDINGVITGSPTFWPNTNILPAGTYYVMSVYSSSGQLVAGPNKITV